MIGRFRRRQDIADEALIETLAASEALHRFRLDQARGRTAPAGRACHADLAWCVCTDGHAVSTGKINAVRRARPENAATAAELAPRLAFGLDAHRPAPAARPCFSGGGR